MTMLKLLIMAILSSGGISTETPGLGFTVEIDGETIVFAPQARAGYVVKRSPKSTGIDIPDEMLLRACSNAKPIRGPKRSGLWIIENGGSGNDSKELLRTLIEQDSVKYAAPLFSINGETVAVIPEIVVRLRTRDDGERLAELCPTFGLAIIKRMEFTEIEYLIEVLGSDADAVFAAVEQLDQIEWIEWAFPNTASRLRLAGQAMPNNDYVHTQDSAKSAASAFPKSAVIPNDEYFPIQWHLNNTGQSGGTPDSDINALEAWEITTGDPNIVVAVLDTGVDSSHPDLINNLVPGYDFVDDDNLPDPSNAHPTYSAHGTNCAGLIAGQGNNAIGVTGVAWDCSIMPIRIGNLASEYFIPDSDRAEAFRWAAENGADIISNSWGNASPFPITHSAIQDITQLGGIGRNGKGCVVLASAGNEDGAIRYPAKYPEVIAVGATDHNDNRCWYSNYGTELDVVAPGGGGVETYDTDLYFSLSEGLLWTTDITGPIGWNTWNTDPTILDYAEKFAGTSASCPVVAGVAALILSADPNLTNLEAQRILEQSAVDLGDPGSDEYYGYGRIDARVALETVVRNRTDSNNDKRIDGKDLAEFAQNWLTCNSPADIIPGPYNKRRVDYGDFAFLANNWLISTECAWHPNPEDGATSVVGDRTITLSWKLGDLDTTGYSVKYDVYVGTDEVAVADATSASPEYMDTVVGTPSYDISGLEAETEHFWRIDTKLCLARPPFNCTIEAPGAIWRFTTGP